MTVKILTGDDIFDVYKKPSKHTTSSMTGGKMAKFTKFYSDNPNKVAMVVSYKEDMLARGLLWNCDNGSKIIDGIYGNHDGEKEILDWAYDNEVIDIFDLTLQNRSDFCVTMKIKRNIFPFIDNFMFGKLSSDRKSIILYCCNNEKINVILCSHEGCIYSLAKR